MKHTIIDASQLELEEKVVAIKRVTKVVKGGRNFRFAALVVVGDKNGHVGAGLGKATEIPEAIRKGKEDAIKKLVEVPINEDGSVPHDFIGKFGSASTIWYPASGYRVYGGGSLSNVGSRGYYWSASPYGQYAYYLYFNYNGGVNPLDFSYRANGLSVRCLQESK